MNSSISESLWMMLEWTSTLFQSQNDQLMFPVTLLGNGNRVNDYKAIKHKIFKNVFNT